MTAIKLDATADFGELRTLKRNANGSVVRTDRHLFRLLLVLALGMVASSAYGEPHGDHAGPPALRLGILGDSSSDEFRGDDDRGGAFASTTRNWLELLVRYRGVDAGAWGSRPLPRRQGYEFNWALSGATTAEATSASAVDGLARQVANDHVSAVVVMVGANDFAIWNGTYERIYSGHLAGEALRRSNAAIVERIKLAVEVISSAGTPKIFVATLLDRSDLPRFTAEFPDANGRQRVSESIVEINAGLQSLADTHRIFLVDQYAASQQMRTRLDARGHFVVGGIAFDPARPGDEPHHLQLGDDEHLGTVGSGVLANIVVDAFRGAGICIAAFTDAEILANAGIDAASSMRAVSARLAAGPSDERLPAIGGSSAGKINECSNGLEEASARRGP